MDLFLSFLAGMIVGILGLFVVAAVSTAGDKFNPCRDGYVKYQSVCIAGYKP